MSLLCRAKQKGRELSGFDIFAGLCFAAAFFFLLWKAPYGFVQADESFYLALPYRLTQNDALLAHEWHLAQLFSFLMYPALKLFFAINGSADGIYLCFRYLFIASQLAIGLYLYLSLRHIQPVGTLFSALMLMCYAPLNIMALSYNTICIMLLAAVGVIFTCADKAGMSSFFAGLLFAAAVLCCPYLVLVYAAYSALCFLAACRRKIKSPFTLAFWLRFTAGCAVLAALLFAFILSRCSLSEVLTTMPQLFADSEHPNYSTGYRLFKYAEAIYGNFWFNAFSLSWPMLGLIMALDKKRLEHRLFYIVPAMIITAAYYAYYVLCDRTVNYLMFPMNILGAFAFILCRRKDMRPFVFFYIPGLLYSLCIHFSSNLGLMSIASAMSISGVASAIYITTLASELVKEKQLFKLVGCCLLLALIMQLSTLCWFRSRYTMWDSDTSELTVRLVSGPQKGIITTAEKASAYYGLIEDSRPVREADIDTVMYLYTDSWLYLMDDARMGCFSPWVSYLHPQQEIKRLQKYWELHPDRLPDMIFLGDNDEHLAMLEQILPESWNVQSRDSGYIISPLS